MSVFGEPYPWAFWGGTRLQVTNVQNYLKKLEVPPQECSPRASLPCSLPAVLLNCACILLKKFNSNLYILWSLRLC